jgi:hypothetical protein
MSLLYKGSYVQQSQVPFSFTHFSKKIHSIFIIKGTTPFLMFGVGAHFILQNDNFYNYLLETKN